MGAVVTPLLRGIYQTRDLYLGETLCGACRDACPVNIDIPRMLLALRAKRAGGDPEWNVIRTNRIEEMIYKMWSWIIQSRKAYDLFLHLAAFGQRFLPENKGMIRWAPPPLNGWTKSRDLKPIAGKRFIQRWKKL
jgi:L-lactate dehydrogenase complex protein LldF